MSQNINNENNDQITNTAGAFQSGATQSDGRDVEFSQEVADHDDLVAQERSKAADQRAKARRKE
ncbi:YfhD family protein [Bacillus massiliigorillae]|uniref:YfhD family protein n=1 Tax=Bacillus massiliigorillae TaxID=1243664 RepID=UPI0003A57E5A|nr:YfhD family protein [Bacillus massiliigorillae]